MSRFNETQQLVRLCEEQGCTVQQTKRNHFKVLTPGGQIVLLAGTSSDSRNVQNAKSHLRRAGVKV